LGLIKQALKLPLKVVEKEIEQKIKKSLKEKSNPLLIFSTFCFTGKIEKFSIQVNSECIFFPFGH